MSLSLENETIEVDTSAWPSSYYRKSQRVDLEKFFQKVQQEQQEQQQLDDDKDRQKRLQRKKEGRTQRQVTFHPDPPTVFVYEPEYDTTGIQLIDQPHSSKDIWPSHARRPPHRLDLRPIRNQHYGQPTPSPSQTSPSTPPLSPCSPSLPEVEVDSSDDEDDDDQPSPTSATSTTTPWTPATSSPPFSPATLTKKLMTAVFTRRKRSQ
ncbi:hypothetical protein BCR42DRAFT_412748 [Absidia repens]|uniref:Uncharacterized protein n=1 Tax=Absidia repens TaxID=90262 RepID=A0A1X2IK64_9FUNG|nr:hypothetical protein BCR42DRAFT_412748 [Absidia repens]